MILICTPTSGRVCSEYMLSLLAATGELRGARVPHRILIVRGVSPIQFARNEAINAFLGCEGATHLMFIDDDMVFKAFDIIALKAAEKDIVGALCPLRTMQAAYNAEPSPNAETEDELVTVNALGTGFLLIARGAIESWYESSTQPLFDCSVNAEGKYVSEDYTFCNRMRALGCKVWAHTRLDIGHVGTHEFRPRHDAVQRKALLQSAWGPT